MQSIKKCGENLAKWNRKSFGNVQHNLKNAKDRLKRLREDDQMNGIEVKFRQPVKMYKCGWKERKSFGDKGLNPLGERGWQKFKIFPYESITQEEKELNPETQDNMGEWKQDLEMERIIIKQVSDLYTMDEQQGEAEFLEPLISRINKEVNFDMSIPFVVEEVVIALQQMDLTKIGWDAPLFF